MKVKSRYCVLVALIFSVGGFLMKVIPYTAKGESIDWMVVASRFIILIVLMAVFWLLFFRETLINQLTS